MKVPVQLATPPSNEAAQQTSSAGLESLWNHVLIHWTEESAHHAFLQSCAEVNQLAFAAAKYRTISKTHAATHREIAEQQLQTITGLAFAMIDASHSPPPRTKRAVTIAAFVISALIMGSCFYALTR